MMIWQNTTLATHGRIPLHHGGQCRNVVHRSRNIKDNEEIISHFDQINCK